MGERERSGARREREREEREKRERSMNRVHCITSRAQATPRRLTPAVLHAGAGPSRGRSLSLSVQATATTEDTSSPDKMIKKLKGKVVSAKMDKTVVVRVTRQFAHPKYGKRIQKNKKFYAHDEENECKEGDIVIVEADTPKSKLKRWKLKEVVEKAVVKE